MGPAYVAIVSLYVLSTLLTLCVVAPSKPHPIDEAADAVLRSSPLRDLKEGMAYVWTTPRMRAAIWIAFLANLTAYPLSNGLLPYVAREIYDTNQTGLGYLSASFAVGSLVGSVLLSLIGGIRVARLMIGATAIWYAALLGRSEEHTSELQSRQYLVCRLLLEKKKKIPILIYCEN